MNNQVPEEKKESLIKTMAIVGFVAIILFIVWLAVQVVSVIPGAFSSLASIADSVYNNQNNKEIVVSTKNSVVNAGESFTVSWSDMPGDGTYSFSYDCVEGAAVDIRKGSGGITSVTCGTEYDLGDITTIDVLVSSEKNRFTDIVYTITYSREGREDVTKDSVMTIVNVSIPVINDLTDEEEVEEPVDTETEVSTNPTTPTLVAGEPTVVKKYIYKVPVSDPNGYVDLQITHLGVGEFDGGIFVPKAEIDQDKKGAIQFEIKNVGTKTAEDWSYEATLPSDISYESGDQKALKPNEKAVITLGFEGITRAGIEKFGAEVTAKGDTKSSNDSYTWSVKVVD